jgi:two-component system response regulator BaeR
VAEQHILVVEDEEKIAALHRDYLVNSGFRVTVLHRGDTVLARLRQHPPDLVLLDLMLPGMDGVSLCQEIRRFSDVPLIMVTARVDEVDRLIGLEIGADDYICKPFSPREVVARVKAVLRRLRPPENPEILTWGPISLSTPAHEAMISGTALKLTPSEFGLLRIFMQRPGRVFSRNELLQQVQGSDFEGYDRTIDSHIKNLRKKIAAMLPDQEVIASVYGVGYRLSEIRS